MSDLNYDVDTEGEEQRHHCLLNASVHLFEPQAEDILTDEDLLDLFRIVKQVLRKDPDPERVSKLLFCMYYALTDHVQFSKPCHEDRIMFRSKDSIVHSVQLPSTNSCCTKNKVQEELVHLDKSNANTPSTVSTPSPIFSQLNLGSSTSNDLTMSTDPFSIRPYTNLKLPSPLTDFRQLRYTPIPSDKIQPSVEIVSEPQQRGFYYQDGRIAREPILLQRYAEQGILTQATLIRKRKKQPANNASSFVCSTLAMPSSTKKPKIPHRHGEFDSRPRIFIEITGDDIISRLRSITMTDLEHKAKQLSSQFTLALEKSTDLNKELISASMRNGAFSKEQRSKLLEPSLSILASHSNMKPHLDNGMNQNGIHYNPDYFRLYLAFQQFQQAFAILFPNEVAPQTPLHQPTSDQMVALELDKDRERNMNMKSYRTWIEPRLLDTNWAAFRRNIIVGERMMQLAQSVGQGILLITKELSGSKLHLTFTNSEWDEFIDGLNSGKWDQTVQWENELKEQCSSITSCSLLVSELRSKFDTSYWFHPDGSVVLANERRLLLDKYSTQQSLFNALHTLTHNSSFQVKAEVK